ncbi:2'-5' RNA ligase [Poseidonocella pacifica]|uniref:RNA 2',3'-cyclic phosphodiesterase n=1 Tax=Poseidonocella pacifica TaxID=871651 RepID=A0A1I0WIA8_9RHOB|nr:RNA 2',3'-cyclic phosphodiesterase [Poseidonocella pacifica]SFA88361.1 2'-5' RNA ligase [Poseidonocella pacifica]
MRLFVGLPLPEELLQPVVALQSRLRGGRPVDEDNLHLTLAFLGECSIPLAQDVDEMLRSLAIYPITLQLGGLDLFGPAVALRATAGPGLVALQGRVAQAVRMAGVDLPRRRFRPHVTVARMSSAATPEQQQRVGRDIQAFGDVSLSATEIAEIALYRSHLRREGAEYEILATYPDFS